MRVLTSNHRNLYQLVFSWDGAFLFATSCDDRWDERGVNSWELGCDSRSKVIGTGSLRATDFAPLPDGKLCVGGLRRFDEGYPFVPVQVVLDPTDPDSRWELPRCDPPTHVAVSPTGDRCVVRGGKKRRRVETLYSFRLPLAPIAEAEWAAKIVPLKGGVLPWFVGYGFDSTGERLWSVERMFFWGGQPERWVFRWRSAATGKVLGRLTPVPEMALFGLTLACKDTRLVGFEKAEIHVVDLIDPHADITKATHPGRKHFTDLAVHPDGRRVFASNNDGTVREYDAVTLQELRAYDWKVGKLTCVAVAPDGLTAAVGSDTGKVVVWDLE